MKEYIRKLMPAFLTRIRKTRAEKKRLDSISVLTCNTDSLLCVDQKMLNKTFNSLEIEKAWNDTEKKIAMLTIPDGTGGVNPGDRRAIYFLIRQFQPRSILEIGTHIGASTVHIAIALKQLRDLGSREPVKLVSVDINDVNDPISQPWLQFGATRSPIEMTDTLECGDFVQFIQDSSITYLLKCQQKFDFVFLDGSHTAEMVYQEIPAALKLINNDGVVLLHDYFPKMKPLWSGGNLISGPYLATERLISEGANLRVLPLGELPWPTKLESNITSLALLSGDRISHDRW